MPKVQTYECPLCHEQVIILDDGAREVGHAMDCDNK